ncbi:MAG TPA: hypothetical protein VH092_35320 [Urbifossiella sp.]|jgi:hypothetical protein|nr:hypothetical protein [Urbifossiella sp.]
MGRREDRDRDRELRHTGRLGAAGGPWVEAQTVAFLQGLPPAELVRVMQQVFAATIPFPGEATFCRSKWFLGIAHSFRRPSDMGELEEWEPWQIEVAAYHRPGDHPGGPNDLGQSSGGGECCGGISHRSNIKSGVCAICGRDVGMT